MTQTPSNQKPQNENEAQADPDAPIDAPIDAHVTGEAEPEAPEIIDADEIVDAQPATDDAELPDLLASVDIEVDEEAGEEVSPQERIDILQAQVSDLNDKLLRSMAEMENVRRRAQREKEDASKYAIAKFAKEMLVVSDNMTRAFASIEGEGKGVNAPADEAASQFKAFIEGVQLTEGELMKTLEKLGLQKIEPLGQRFDANLHEALFEFEDKEQPAGTVSQVLEQGYTLNGRLLRAAKVGITKGGPKGTTQPKETNPADEATASESKTVYETKSEEPGSQVNEEL